MSRRRVKIEDCISIAEQRGGKCLSTEYKNTKTKMLWECSLLHQWEACFSHIQNGTWCPKCARNIKLSLLDCKISAGLKNGFCLSKEYINNQTKMKWGCMYGHIWSTTYGKIRNGSWCPYCSKNVRLSITDCQNTARDRGGECLSDEYINSQTKMLWRCSYGHRWEANYSTIRTGRWCRKCAGRARLSLKDCKSTARDRNGHCLSNIYHNNRTKMKWRCSEGHIWEAKYTHVLSGSWCPRCHSSSGQIIVLNTISNILNTSYITNNRDLVFLKNIDTNRNLEIDGWFPDIKLAVEYDGIQHFEPIDFFGGDNRLEYIVKNDKIKNMLVKKAIKDGEINHFIRFRYDEPLEKEYIKERLIKSGVIDE